MPAPAAFSVPVLLRPAPIAPSYYVVTPTLERPPMAAPDRLAWASSTPPASREGSTDILAQFSALVAAVSAAIHSSNAGEHPAATTTSGSSCASAVAFNAHAPLFVHDQR